MIKKYFLPALALLICIQSVAKGEDLHFIYSAPKTGTHLLNKAVGLLTGRLVVMNGKHEQLVEEPDFFNYLQISRNANQIVHTHRFPPQSTLSILNQNQVKMLSVVRDPRDQLISLIFHQHRCRVYLPDYILPLPNPDEPLTKEDVHYLLDLILVQNMWPYKSYQYVINDPFSLQFLNQTDAYIVRFEDLVGNKGGGSDKKQLQCLKDICRFLNIQCSKKQLKSVQERLFGGTWSFRSGQIGAWKQYFSEEHQLIFKKRYHSVLNDLGY